MVTPIKYKREKDGEERMDLRMMYFLKGEKAGRVTARIAESDHYFVCLGDDKTYRLVDLKYLMGCLFFESAEDRDEYASGQGKKKKSGGKVEVPEELRGLELYENNEKLLRKWDSLIKSWRLSCPGVDIQAEVAAAHSWELSCPSKRKVDKCRFLNRWLKKAQDAPNGRGGPAKSDQTAEDPALKAKIEPYMALAKDHVGEVCCWKGRLYRITDPYIFTDEERDVTLLWYGEVKAAITNGREDALEKWKESIGAAPVETKRKDGLPF